MARHHYPYPSIAFGGTRKPFSKLERRGIKSESEVLILLEGRFKTTSKILARR